MSDKKELLAYCGLYCGRCLGYTGVVADAAKELKMVIDRYRFDRTAEGVFPDDLKEFGEFYKTLTFITDLRCPGKCRQGKDTETSCKVRKCCREKEFFACHECDNFEICEKLKDSMGGLHFDSCVKNLKAIKQMGIDAWMEKGKKLWYWDMEDTTSGDGKSSG